MKKFAAILSLFLLVGVGFGEEAIEYNRDIRPILSDRCFFCHGPDKDDRKADLRLDIRSAAIEQGSLIPGDPEGSEIVYRLFTDDEDDLMPPPKSHKTMSAGEKELIVKWIKQGAEYEESWSLTTPKKVEVATNVSPIDHFVSERLTKAGLKFSEQADARTLIRRVSLDLCGMVPTPEQVDGFLKDIEVNGLDKAYSELVDRLLASPAYGERMTFSWMDAARYGDTSVMHADGPRDMWPWRDWVINAYNNNMPFDRFTIEQLAGDLLPNATVDQKVASGFNRNHATSDEGGAFAEELRVEYVVDRVQTTSTVWMGLTMACAQCHDHKYDPISQKEYFQFYAFFNNTQDPGMQTRKGNQKPLVQVVSKEREDELARLEAQLSREDKKLSDYKEANKAKLATWAEVKHQELVAKNPEATSHDLAGLKHWIPISSDRPNQIIDQQTGVEVVLTKGKHEISQRNGQSALKINGSEYTSSSAPNLKAEEPFSFAAWVNPSKNAGGAIFAQMDVDQGYRGYDLWMQSLHIGTHLIHSWPNNALKVVSVPKLKPNVWQHVVLTYDGSYQAAGVKIYIDGKLVKNKVETDRLTGSLTTSTPFKIGSRSNTGNWKGEVDDIRIYNRVLAGDEIGKSRGDVIEPILLVAASKRSPEQEKVLFNHYFSNVDKGYKKISKKRQELQKRYSDLESSPATSMVMADNPANEMRKTYVLDRGSYDAPLTEEEIFPGVPAALPALAKGAPANRLGLAQWLTRDDHPLTSRVAVNRYWMMLFGDGLVRTVEDFGAQGVPPTHPKLLDWLAVDFVESGWDVKRMLKQIVLSRTYRQRSNHLPEHLEKDPQNLLLARSPRFRLPGEMIRDQALTVSGLLVDQVGGAGVKPYQPPNIWNEVSLNKGLRYKQDQGDKLYRKSIYTYWKRSAPMPNLSILNVPSREKCVIQRARTNTPLQALVTLNDPQFIEAARHFAQRILKAESDIAKRIDYAFQLCLSRSATLQEQKIIKGMLADFQQRFKDNPEDAQRYLEVGDSGRENSLDSTELAAWTVIGQTILNLDETLNRN